MTPNEFGETPVTEYVTAIEAVVRPDDRVAAVADRLRSQSRGGSLPVVDEADRIVGVVGALDVLGADGEASVETVMNRRVVAIAPETSLRDATRVILRTGHQRLPVVDDDGTVLGVFSNADALRSRIERTTPRKVERTRNMLQSTHDALVTVREGRVALSSLIPTQAEVCADELVGRAYELERGLAEPLIVLTYGHETLLVDGHHRALAAQQLDIEEMQAYVLVVDPDEVPRLGLRRAAYVSGLESLDDVTLTDYVADSLSDPSASLFE
jgi:IMP dehydrogenase